jgi:hypothetical protein
MSSSAADGEYRKNSVPEEDNGVAAKMNNNSAISVSCNSKEDDNTSVSIQQSSTTNEENSNGVVSDRKQTKARLTRLAQDDASSGSDSEVEGAAKQPSSGRAATGRKHSDEAPLTFPQKVRFDITR